MKLKVKSEKTLAEMVKELEAMRKSPLYDQMLIMNGYTKVPMTRVIDRGYVSDGEGCVEPDYDIKKY